ncbi:MAG TPA: hypothetical protein VFY06_12460 [Verrucomicrobiae bacterium]|nr:hypothetical protein [Verrucomicrobiae bacterium]
MNAKIGLAILAVACAGLAIALVVVERQSSDQAKASSGTITEFSNQLVDAHEQIIGLNQANLSLTNALAASREQSLAVSNQLTEKLADTAGLLSTTTAALQDARQQVTNLNTHVTGLNARIADLEMQNATLDQRASSLSNMIASLDSQISITQMKLATSTTNNEFLARELKRQLAEKAELERKFNDIAEVRAQIRKLHYEQIAARRLEWMREGIDPSQQVKGAQLLMMRSPPAGGAADTANSSAYDLNVEIGSDGSMRVIPPMTNQPPATNSSSH